MREEVRCYGTLKELTVYNNNDWPMLIWLFEFDDAGKRQGVARCYEMLEGMCRRMVGQVIFKDDVVTGRTYYGQYRPIHHAETRNLLSISSV